MHIVACIKQVPDTTQVKIDPETNTLVRAGVESICNPYDLVAVEAGVRVAEKYGGKVTVITMGPPQADSALRQCLSLGASEAILLSDRAFAGSDTLATSYTLAQAVNKLNATEPVSLVICGKQAIDGDTAQTGPGLATWMDYTQLTYVVEIIEVADGFITVKREVEGGTEVIRGKLPALLTVELELNPVRYATLPELVRSLRQEIKVLGAKDIGGEPERYGLKGSPTSVKQIFAPPPHGGGKVFETASDSDKVIEDFLSTFFEKESSILSEVLSSDGSDHAQEQ
ncbi:MAG: electron transfer flavoprotein subunit beta/FixA family protein [Chloroflexi bacterium]|nr:electron transfer flavoprotein subunit beta/FixA family protein [Chloroflexota bacterium]